MTKRRAHEYPAVLQLRYGTKITLNFGNVEQFNHLIPPSQRRNWLLDKLLVMVRKTTEMRQE